jgi:predicted  nucleic acid-binding Zn-ribbon protein
MDILTADTKENAKVFVQISEKETFEWLNKNLKEELKRKDKELEGLKNQIIEYEREMAKLREKLRYLKDASERKIAQDKNEDNKWKQACEGLKENLKNKEQEITNLKDKQIKIMSLVRENNKQFNNLIAILTEVFLLERHRIKKLIMYYLSMV